MKKILVQVPIFLRHVFFVGDCSVSEAEDAIYKLKGKRTQCSLTATAEGCVRTVGGDIYIWVKDTKRASIVAHELVHAACSIMEACNIPQCRETEEVMCYLVGWLKINIQDKVYFSKSKRKKQ